MFETKMCSKCKIEKPTTEFYRSRDKLFSWCKKCKNEQHKIYSDKNREKINIKQKENYKKNIEDRRYKQQIYRDKNREKVYNYNKKYYEEHKEYFSNHAKNIGKNI